MFVLIKTILLITVELLARTHEGASLAKLTYLFQYYIGNLTITISFFFAFLLILRCEILKLNR